jgi:hypothetical protein
MQMAKKREMHLNFKLKLEINGLKHYEISISILINGVYFEIYF